MSITDQINQGITDGTITGSGLVDGMSFVGLTKVINQTLSHYGWVGNRGQTEISPQYVRELCLKGQVDGVVRTSMKDVRFTDDQVNQFVVKFVGPKVVHLVQTV